MAQKLPAAEVWTFEGMDEIGVLEEILAWWKERSKEFTAIFSIVFDDLEEGEEGGVVAYLSLE